MEKFIIIGGMPRSGTNLARRLIGSHSMIAIPPTEFQFFKNHSQGKSVSQILKHERLTDWQIDVSDLYETDPQTVYTSTLQRYAKNIGKSIPGEKSPHNEFYLATIEAWLQDFDLKFVHMLRNPIDVIASYKHKPFGTTIEDDDIEWISNIAHRWRRSASIGLARAHSLPNQHMVIKFEDLTTTPAVETRSLCEFIGVEFEEERMLNLTDYVGHKDNTSFTGDMVQSEENKQVYRPASRKQHLTNTELEVIGKICGELAWALDYIDESLQPAPPTKRISPSSIGILRRIRRLPKALFSKH